MFINIIFFSLCKIKKSNLLGFENSSTMKLIKILPICDYQIGFDDSIRFFGDILSCLIFFFFKCIFWCPNRCKRQFNAIGIWNTRIEELSVMGRQHNVHYLLFLYYFAEQWVVSGGVFAVGRQEKFSSDILTKFSTLQIYASRPHFVYNVHELCIGIYDYVVRRHVAFCPSFAIKLLIFRCIAMRNIATFSIFLANIVAMQSFESVQFLY